MEVIMEFINECGRFITDENGVLLEHICNEDIITVDEKHQQSGKGYIEGTYDYLIIPEGVTGFAPDFYRWCNIKNKLVLPDSLTSIGFGNEINSIENYGCVFANCVLPDVILPESLEMIGKFAFGNSRLNSLRIPENLNKLQQCYLRQFKETIIEKLYLPLLYKPSNADSRVKIVHLYDDYEQLATGRLDKIHRGRICEIIAIDNPNLVAIITRSGIISEIEWY